MLSAPIVVTPPSEAAIALALVKQFLRVDGDAFDIEIGVHLAGAVAAIEQMTGTYLTGQEVEVTADSFDDLDHLQVGPVNAIVSLTYVGVDQVARTLAADQYVLTGAALARGIAPARGRAWPAIAAGADPITVHLDVGYESLPASLQAALLILVRSRFDGEAIDISAMIVNDRILM
jgi:uncharacterized phiE125 gp8 family phage protein